MSYQGHNIINKREYMDDRGIKPEELEDDSDARRECLHCGCIVWLRDDEEQRCPDCGWEVE